MSNPLLVSLGFKVPEWFRIWSCRFLTSGLQPGEIVNILPWESMESVTIGTCQPMHHWKQLRWSDSHVMCHLVTLSSWQVHLPTFDKHVSAGCGQFPTCNGRIWSENCAKPTQIGIIHGKGGGNNGKYMKKCWSALRRCDFLGIQFFPHMRQTMVDIHESHFTLPELLLCKTVRSKCRLNSSAKIAVPWKIPTSCNESKAIQWLSRNGWYNVV